MLKLKNLKKDKVLSEMPEFLAFRFMKFVVIGALAAILGIIVTVTGLSGDIWLQSLLFFLAVSASMCALAFAFRYRVLYHGYDVIDGKITYVKYKASFRKDSTPILYHLTDEEGHIYGIPVFKGNLELPKGSAVRIYIPKDGAMMETQGILQPTTLWGFELIGGSSEESGKQSAETEKGDDV